MQCQEKMIYVKEIFVKNLKNKGNVCKNSESLHN